MLKHDVIGYWSEIKLAIIRDYGRAYSKIVTAKRFHAIFIDGFAGAGTHISKRTDEEVKGSPRVAFDVVPPFEQFHFVEARFR